MIFYAEFIVALSWVFVSNVSPQSTDCGHVNAVLQNTNSEGAWPWMAAITKKERNGNYNFWCNGFLIDRRHVLTAAHCYGENYAIGDFLIRIGKMNWKEGEAYTVTCIKKHPSYEGGKYYDDIAILTLNRNVDTPNYVPICIPDDNLRIMNMSGIVVTKTAWGALRSGGNTSETLIQNEGLRIRSQSDCNLMFGKLMRSFYFEQEFSGGISSDMICTEKPTDQTESCGRDTGAPLMYRDDSNKWVAVGISIYGFCRPDAPTDFTKVSAYLEFITENTVDDEGNCS